MRRSQPCQSLLENVHFSERDLQAQRLKRAQQGIFKVLNKAGATRAINQGEGICDQVFETISLSAQSYNDD